MGVIEYMTEVHTETQPTFINPDGKENPVFFSWTTKRGTQIVTRKVRIVNSGEGIFDYAAINPKTGKEVRLGDVQWVQVYYSLLNKQPPEELTKRVRQYYKIREQKAKEKAKKENLQYAPFDDLEPAAA